MQPFLDVIWLEKCYVTIAIGIAHSIQFNSLSFFLSLTSKGLSPQLMDSMDQSVEGSIAKIWRIFPIVGKWLIDLMKTGFMALI